AGSYSPSREAASRTPAITAPTTPTAGPAAKLASATQPPASAQNAILFAQQPTVQLQDAAGNPVSQSGTPVAAVIASGGGVLGGTLSVQTGAGGLATFTNLMITGVVGPRTLAFSAGALTGATSGTVS